MAACLVLLGSPSAILVGRWGTYTYYFFIAYLLGITLVQSKLRLIENEPQRTMEEQQRKSVQAAAERANNGAGGSGSSTTTTTTQQSNNTPTGTPSKSSKKKNKKYQHKVDNGSTTSPQQPSYAAVASKGTEVEPEYKAELEAAHVKGIDGKPSYAAMASKGTKAEHDYELELEEAKATSSTPDGSSTDAFTQRASNNYVARGMSIPNRPNPLQLLFGYPSSSRKFNLFTLAVNLLLVVFCLDFQFTPLLGLEVKDTTFVRVGHVDDHSVKLVARLPPSVYDAPHRKRDFLRRRRHLQESSSHSHSNASIADAVSTPAGVRVAYRPTRPVGAWQYGGLLAPESDTDYVGSLKLTNLMPSTEYEYALALPLTSPEDEETHNEADYHLRPNIHAPQYFRTTQDPKLARHSGSHFTFAASSCIKPGWPYVPFQDHTHIKGAGELADRISRDRIEFLMFMGDFIYADAPSKVHSQAAYAKKYRQTFASPEYRRVYEKIPTYHIYDDHEIVNDYAGEGNDSSPFFQLANPAYTAYLASGNPDPVKPDTHYYEFDNGDTAFFVWDTRRYRTNSEAEDNEEKTMLGLEQKEVFLDWLARVNNTATFKFVVSSVPFMTLWGSPTGQDTWAGYTHERSELLDTMQYVPNLIILSGDRHEFAAATVRDTVLDFSISPLNQFYIPVSVHEAGQCMP